MDNNSSNQTIERRKKGEGREQVGKTFWGGGPNKDKTEEFKLQ